MKKFGVIGFPVMHSLSPKMYNAGFNEIDFQGFYEFCEVNHKNLNCFMKRVKSGEFAGLSVTVPYKESVKMYCDEFTDSALKIGAVNCLYFSKNKLIGHNTDWYGFLESLKEIEKDFSKKKILVIGAGGAARAVVYALNVSGVLPSIANRTKSRLLDFQTDFEVEIVDFNNLPECEILINATSVGLKNSDNKLVNEEYLKSGIETVFDLIYKDTPLVSASKKIGLKTVDAKRMLLWQAVEQFEIFTGENCPVEVLWKSII
jgi:shikimate dehydrogenase